MKKFYISFGIFGGFAFLCLLVAGFIAGRAFPDALTQKNNYCVANNVTCQNLDDDANDVLSWSNRIDENNLSPTAALPYERLAFTGAACGKATGEPCIEDGDIATVEVDKFTSIKCSAQATPDNTVLVAAGFFTFNDGSTLSTISFAGGTSPAFPDGIGGGSERIDVLTIDGGGALAITAGTAASPPAAAPAYPSDKVALCEVLLRPGFSQIKDSDDASEGYIKQDARGFFANFPALRFFDSEVHEHFFANVVSGKLGNGGAGCVNGITTTGHFYEALCNAATDSQLVSSNDTGSGAPRGPDFRPTDAGLDPVLQFRFKQVEAVDSNSCFQLGYRLASNDTAMDAGTVPTDGIYFEVSGSGTIRPVIRKDSSETLGANFTIATDTWHVLKIVIDSSVPDATFTLDGAGSVTLSGSNFPDDEDLQLGFNFCSVDTGTHTMRMDSVDWSFSPSVLSP